jgi:hypothetical protein
MSDPLVTTTARHARLAGQRFLMKHFVVTSGMVMHC